MSHEEFKALLNSATEGSKQFAKNYVTDVLPERNRYDIYLSISHDDPALPQFDIYPEDDNKILKNASADEATNTLLRKGKVPVWIDISVYQVRNNTTIFTLLCAGRYSDDTNEFYYQRNDTGPFGVKSPVLPPCYEEGKKFVLPKSRSWFMRFLKTTWRSF